MQKYDLSLKYLNSKFQIPKLFYKELVSKLERIYLEMYNTVGSTEKTSENLFYFLIKKVLKYLDLLIIIMWTDTYTLTQFICQMVKSATIELTP